MKRLSEARESVRWGRWKDWRGEKSVMQRYGGEAT